MREFSERLKVEEFAGIKEISKEGLRENFENYVVKSTGESSLRKYFWQGTILTLFANFPTAAGSVLRGRVYKTLLGHIGSHCFIEKNVRFNIPQKVFLGNRVIIGESSWFDIEDPESEIRIGDEVKIGRYCTFRAGPGDIFIDEQVNFGAFNFIAGYGGIEIGKYSAMGHHVVIMTYNHVFEDPSIPIRFQDLELNRVSIGEGVWLGTHVVVLPGVTIGDGSVVGAGSVVTKDIPPYCIAVGVPAKVIRKR
jgi:acetyltransferase-like isoleucine patch superfamily enzyme